jgi:hypothetical protein
MTLTELRMALPADWSLLCDFIAAGQPIPRLLKRQAWYADAKGGECGECGGRAYELLESAEREAIDLARSPTGLATVAAGYLISPSELLATRATNVRLAANRLARADTVPPWPLGRHEGFTSEQARSVAVA